MKKLILSLLGFAIGAASLLAQPTPAGGAPAATQAEVDAGIVANKYVSPKTLAGASAGGSVTTVSVTTANGVSGSVANPTTTPAITLTLGAITPTSVSTGALTSSTLTSGRVPFLTTAGLFTDDADLTFATDTLTSTKIAATTFTGIPTLSGTTTIKFGATSAATIGASADTTAGNLLLTVPGTGGILATMAGTGSGQGIFVIQNTNANSTNQVSLVNTSGSNGALMGFSLYHSTSTVAANFIYQLAGGVFGDGTEQFLVATRVAAKPITFIVGGYQAADVSLQITGMSTLLGGPGSMTITSGTGNSRTMTFKTTTSGGTATTALTLSATQTVAINSTSPISGVRTATATLNFASILAAGFEDLTISVTGAAVNDVVDLGPPATVLAGAIFNAWVSAADTVTVRCNNAGSIAVDPASATYRVSAMSF